MKQIQVVTTFLFLSLCPLWAQQSSKTPSPPGTVTGSGTTNYVPVWTGSTTQGNSTMYQTDGRIGIGTTSPQYALDVSGHINSSSGYLIGEELVLIAPGGVDGGNIAVGIDSIPSSTPGLYNTAMGDFSLEAVTSGGANVALGYSALNLDTSGGANTAIGSGAMSYNTEGGENTAAGDEALYLNTTGSNNTATGWEALLASNATGNVADGSSALAFNTTGNYNTGVGANALSSNQSGTGNIAVGYGALGNNTTGTANIAIGYMAGLTTGSDAGEGVWASQAFVKRYPFVATSLYHAFCAAKDSAREKMRYSGTLRYMLPWLPDDVEEIDRLFGGDCWPYGIEPNRPTLEALVTYMVEQGLIAAPIPIEKLFVPTFG